METVHSLLHSIQSLVSNPEKRIKSENKSSLPKDPSYHVDDMNNFESYSKGTIKMEEDDDLINEKRRLKEMEDFASDIASRAAILRDGVLGLLRTVAQGASSNSKNANDASSTVPALKEQIATLESELQSTESKLEEMANARNEASSSERRVRRGLHRIAAGRGTVEEVLEAVEDEDDNGVSFEEKMQKIDGLSSPNGTTGASAVISSSDGVGGAMSSPAFSAAVGSGGSKDSPTAMNGVEVAQLKKDLQEVQVRAESRDKKIAEVSALNMY